MAGFLNKIKSAGSATATQPTKDALQKKKDEIVLEVTPLEKMLQNAGPLREDGSDRFFGFENFGNTCYCNSIVQALFYSDLFRDNVIKYPPYSPSETPNGTNPKVHVTIRPPMNPTPPAPQPKSKIPSTSQVLKQRQAINAGAPAGGQAAVKPEDKPDTPEYKKKQAMLKGPILELAQENAMAYGMDECTFTGLKDIFLALLESSTRTGVLSPQRFLEIFKRDNEMFRNSMHQDAHEFYGLVLNDVIANVEANARRIQEDDVKRENGLIQSVEHALGTGALNNATGYRSPGTGWVHDIFEGVLTSETKCLTCETASQRDETFLDLSIDLEEHSSVTSCLRKFSAEEMLCERNKFHCDHCGGLQEAEKRMKVKRLPKVLTLHLKRFKYTEDYSRLQKLFHRVVYPYHLRMFNTTEDAEDPDRMYELYAVVVHIGGNAYHGHYVSIIKTKDRGWVLFDDEMVEPVDKHFVRNFFGDKPGMATAYVLFYQETTFEKVREEQEKEGMEEVKLATQAANVAHEDSDKADTAPLKRQATQPTAPTPEPEVLSKLAHAQTAPDLSNAPPVGATPPSPAVPPVPALARTPTAKHDAKNKDDKKREKKEREAAEKAAKLAEKESQKQAKEAEKEREKQLKEDEKKRRDEQLRRFQAHRQEQEELQKVLDESKKTAAKENQARKKETNGNGAAGGMAGILDRSKRGSKSMSKKSFSFFHKDKGGADGAAEGSESGELPEKQEKKGRLSMGLGRKKSSGVLS
ncbi:ubiquitin carboxyl-terminal hydrolase 12 [Purpureocillium lavendulum]|uniref:Ubiquitin carboxyl-terminal hydrolase n=1 Tax=Purpureocillium lavendulum TaxID=1247861 RepID=A0AB34G4C8_9HYPO|nr:ubiquitin carboxyl-terminal hydrolase 12 [Purpureocillium lavendulum]